MGLNKNFVAMLSSAVLSFTLLALSLASSGKTQSVTPTVDPQLKEKLAAVDDATLVRAVLTYDQKPTEVQVERVRATGVAVKTFSVLPMLGVEGTKSQIEQLFSLEGVVSVWQDRPLNYLLHESVPKIGATTQVCPGLGLGTGVGVAVIDSGVDGTHPDVKYPGRLVQNVKITGGPNLSDGGNSLDISVVEGLHNTDTSSGHGTHVAGTIGGSGTTSKGYYTGVAPGANLVGIGAGDVLFILYALEGFDYALANQQKYNIQVISNSWGTTGEFDEKDPINQASKLAHDRGITVVFAAGNEGPGQNTLNPYSVATWVIGVAAGNKDGTTLADFSSRGVPGSKLYHPTITAPGVDIVSTRASTGATINALAALDDVTMPPEYLPFYTTASGTSMATPHVSGTVALLEEANPDLTPDAIKQLLTKTATPMPNYQQYQVGAGYLNTCKAVMEAKSSRSKAQFSKSR